jgi:hypothetical protein
MEDLLPEWWTMMPGGQIRAAGMFIELGPVESYEPQESIFDNVLDEKLPDLALVVGYLRGGRCLFSMMDIVRDPFDPAEKIVSGSSVYTDGEWLWREDFAYYVERHQVAVPEGFLTLIRERNYTVPIIDDARRAACVREARRLMFEGG